MRIQCWSCGGTRIIFSCNGDQYGQHHGARCAQCMKPLSLKDFLFISYEKEMKDKARQDVILKTK